MFLVSCFSCLCPIHWSQVLSQEWRCSWSSADRQCSNYIWVITNRIAYQGPTYIRGLMVNLVDTPNVIVTNVATAWWCVSNLFLVVFQSVYAFLRWRHRHVVCCWKGEDVLFSTSEQFEYWIIALDSCLLLSNVLTHCGLMTPNGDRDLGQHWFR